MLVFTIFLGFTLHSSDRLTSFDKQATKGQALNSRKQNFVINKKFSQKGGHHSHHSCGEIQVDDLLNNDLTSLSGKERPANQFPLKCFNQPVTLRGSVIENIKLISESDSFTKSLINIKNSDFFCYVNKIQSSSTNSNSAQLIHFIGHGTHLIEGTQFIDCGEAPNPQKKLPKNWGPTLILCEGKSTNIFHKGLFDNSIRAQPTRFIRVRHDCSLNMTSFNCDNSRSYEKGSFLLLETKNLVNLLKCEVKNSKQLGEGDVAHSIFISAENTGKVTISSSTFLDCGSKSGNIIESDGITLYFIDNKVTFSNQLSSSRCLKINRKGFIVLRNNFFSNVQTNYNEKDASIGTVVTYEGQPSILNNVNEYIIIEGNTFDNIVGDNDGRCIFMNLNQVHFKQIKSNTVKNCPTGGFLFKFIFTQKVNTFTIDSCSFINNNYDDLSKSTAGILIQNSDSSSLKLIYQNCNFERNLFSNSLTEVKTNLKQFELQFSFLDCKFNNNDATENGGAISIRSNNEFTIKGCTFIDNKSKKKGGAIYIDSHFAPSKVNIEDCIFKFNSALNGYAIYIEGDQPKTVFTIHHNEFINNHDEEEKDYSVEKSLIYPKSLSLIKENTFTIDEKLQLLAYDESSINDYSNKEISNKKFTVYIDDSVKFEGIHNSNFINCQPIEGEDYLFVVKKKFYLQDLSFTFLDSKIGAIKVENTAKVSIRNCTFNGNSNNNNFGSFVYFANNQQLSRIKENEEEEFTTEITDATYNSCPSNTYAFTCDYLEGSILIQNNVFNFSTQTDKCGGIKVINNNQRIKVVDCSFTNIVDLGSIYYLHESGQSHLFEIDNCSFNQCSGRCCIFDVQSGISDQISLTNNVYNECTKGESNSLMIGLTEKSNSLLLNIKNNTLKSCQTTGFAIEFTLSNAPDNLEPIIFEDIDITYDDYNNAGYGIQVLQQNRDITFRNCTFKYCYKGGGPYWASSIILDRFSNVIIEECKFDDCGINGGGNVMCMYNDVQKARVENCTFNFSFNQNDKCGSAISTYTDNIVVIGNSFTKCASNSILINPVNNHGKFELIDNYFTECNLGNIIGMGNNKLSQMPIIKGNTFENNNNGIHFLIKLDQNVNSLLFENNTFKNHVSQNGGFSSDIQIDSSSFEITFLNCFFIESSQNTDGGAFKSSTNNAKLTFDGCTFSKNTAKGNGGAIYINTQKESVISNCIFNENTADQNGGAIYIDNNQKTTISKCTFTSNKASNDLALNINNQEAQLIIDNETQFTSNINEELTQYMIVLNNVNTEIENVQFSSPSIDINDKRTFGAVQVLCRGTVLIKDTSFINIKKDNLIYYSHSETATDQNSLTLDNCTFENIVGCSLYINVNTGSLDSINIEGCTFNQCKKIQGRTVAIGASQTSDSISLNVENCKLNNCGNDVESDYIIFLEINNAPNSNGEITFNNNVFHFDSVSSGIISSRIIQEGKTVTFHNCTFENSPNCPNNGIWENTISVQKLALIVIEQCTFTECGHGGNIIVIQSETQQAIIQNCSITYAQSSYGQSASLVATYIDNIAIIGNSINKCNRNVIRIECLNKGDTFKLIDNYFSGCRLDQLVTIEKNKLSSPPIIKGNTFEDNKAIKDADTNYTKRLFKFVLNDNVESILFDNNTFKDEKSVFGGFGGEITTDRSSIDITFSNCYFINNKPGTEGGGFNHDTCTKASLSFIDCVFSGNEGTGKGGAITIKTSQDVLIDGCIFTGNKAVNGGEGDEIYIYANEQKNDRTITIQNCAFDETNGVSCSLNLLSDSSEKVIIHSNTFNKCGTPLSLNQTANSISLEIENNTFTNCPKKDNIFYEYTLSLKFDRAPDNTVPILFNSNSIIYDDPNKAGQGLFVQQENRDIIIRNCTFKHCLKGGSNAHWSSSIIAEQFANVNIEECYFNECGIKDGGNVICIYSDVIKSRIESCTFYFSSNDQCGSGISTFIDNIAVVGNKFIKCNENTIRIETTRQDSLFELIDNYFTGCNKGKIINIEQNSIINRKPTIRGNTFENNVSPAESFNLRLSSNIDTIELENNTFNNHKSKIGSFGITLEQSADNINFKLINCFFINNIPNADGGGFKTDDSLNKAILTFDGCTFSNNEANGRGGGLFAKVQNKLTITNCNFEDNTASTNGCAIYR